MATKKVLVEINVEQKGNSIPKTTKEVDKLAKATERLANEQKQEAIEIAKVNYQISLQQQSNKKLAKSQVLAATSIENTTNKMQEFKTTSGLTGAIVTEFGRTASDSAYGIRGMGNNISQIVTLFGQLQANTKRAGGTIKDSFNQIFQSMKGVIGLMTAIQVVLGVLQAEWFQKWAAGLLKTIGLLDAFKGRLDVLNDVFKEASEIAGESVRNFKRYTDVVKDSSSSIEQKKIAIEKLNDEFPDYNTNLLLTEGNTKKITQANDDYIDSLVRKAKAVAAESKLNEIESEKFALTFEAEKEMLEAKDDYENDFYVKRLSRLEEVSEKRIEFEKLGGQAAIDAAREYAESDKLFKEFNSNQGAALLEGQINAARLSAGKAKEEYSTELKGISDSLKEDLKEFEPDETILERLLGDLSGKKTPNKNPLKRGFRSRLLELKTLAERFRQESLKGEVKTDEELIKQKAEFSKKDLAIKLNNYIETERLRLKEFLETKGLSKKQKDAARKASEESIDRAKEDSKIVLENIEAVYDAEINLLRRKEGEKARIEQEALEEQERRKIIDRAGDTVVGYDSAFHQAQDARLQAELEIIQKRISAAEEGSLEMSNIEEEYYQASNQRIAFNTEQEKLSLEERTRIIEEYISYLKGASSVLAAIGNKNKDFQKAQLLAEKISAIASVSVQAARSVGTQIADSKASSLSNIRNWQFAGGSLNPVATASYIATEAKIKKDRASGIANTKIGAGLSIAAITAGAISGLSDISNSGSSSSSSSSGSVQPPDFNIVGSTGVNQLADAIGSTETPIVKAVVVASEVTTQQALDRNNRSNAEL